MITNLVAVVTITISTNIVERVPQHLEQPNFSFNDGVYYAPGSINPNTQPHMVNDSDPHIKWQDTIIVEHHNVFIKDIEFNYNYDVEKSRTTKTFVLKRHDEWVEDTNSFVTNLHIISYQQK